MNPIFLMIFADDCGACSNFKNSQYQQLYSALNGYPKITPLEISLKSMMSPLPSDIPKDLRRFIKFYPSFLIIPYNSWINAKNGAKLENVLMYGLTMDEKGNIYQLPGSAPNKDNIINWIKTNVDNEPSLSPQQNFKSSPEIKTPPLQENSKMIPTEGLCRYKKVSKRS